MHRASISPRTAAASPRIYAVGNESTIDVLLPDFRGRSPSAYMILKAHINPKDRNTLHALKSAEDVPAHANPAKNTPYAGGFPRRKAARAAARRHPRDIFGHLEDIFGHLPANRVVSMSRRRGGRHQDRPAKTLGWVPVQPNSRLWRR